MADDNVAYKKIMEKLDQLDEKIDTQYNKLKAYYQELSREVEIYQSQLNNLREQFYDLRRETRMREYHSRTFTKKDRYTFQNICPAGLPSLGNSATDPDYELFLPEEYPDV